MLHIINYQYFVNVTYKAVPQICIFSIILDFIVVSHINFRLLFFCINY